MIIFGSLQNLYENLSLVPSKSMLKKRNHDFMERYPNIKVGTYKPMRIKDILTKTVCLPYTSNLEYEYDTNDLKGRAISEAFVTL